MELEAVTRLIEENNFEKAFDILLTLDTSQIDPKEFLYYKFTLFNKMKKYQSVIDQSEAEDLEYTSDVDIRLLNCKFSAYFGLMDYEKASKILDKLIDFKNSSKIHLQERTIYQINYSAMFNFQVTGK